ncbi:hypothetical protein DSECCO2_631220 [anaerobic digester metagenome]
MPHEVWPRSLAFLISRPPGMTVPTGATGTFWPAATLGAPQTMSSSSPVPMSTRQTERWSEEGCAAHSATKPTTIFSREAKGRPISSTSRPSMVSLSARVWASPV